MKLNRFLIVAWLLILGVASVQAVAMADGASADDTSPNAFMTVSAWRDDTHLASWNGHTRWNDVFGVFRARVEGGRLSWQGRSAENPRVETDEQGVGGKSLISWLPRKANLVVVVVAPYGMGENPAGGTGTRTERDARKPRPPVAPADTLEAAAGQSTAGAASSRATGHSSAGTGDTDTDAEEADTEALIHRLTGGASGGSGEDTARGQDRGQGDLVGTGTEHGKAGGGAGGQQGGITANQGGVGDAYAARRDGRTIDMQASVCRTRSWTHRIAKQVYVSPRKASRTSNPMP